MQLKKEVLQSDLVNLKTALTQKASEYDQILGRIQAVESLLSVMDKPEIEQTEPEQTQAPSA